MEGPFIEYSGPSLALFKWTFYMKQLVFGSLFFNLFVGWPRVTGWGAAGALVNFAVTFAAVLVLSLVVVLIDATNPRLRIDQSLRVLRRPASGVAAVGAGLAATGVVTMMALKLSSREVQGGEDLPLGRPGDAAVPVRAGRPRARLPRAART